MKSTYQSKLNYFVINILKIQEKFKINNRAN